MHRRQTNCSMKEDNLRITPAFPAASVSPTLPSLSPSALALVARPLSVVAVLPAVFGFLLAVCVLPPLSLQTPPPFPGVKHSLAWTSILLINWSGMSRSLSLSLTHTHTHTRKDMTSKDQTDFYGITPDRSAPDFLKLPFLKSFPIILSCKWTPPASLPQPRTHPLLRHFCLMLMVILKQGTPVITVTPG